MAIKVTKEKILETLKRYRIVILIFLVGIVLVLFPTQTKQVTDSTCQTVPLQEPSTEQKLCEILGKIHGVGDVSVMLTAISGEEIIYQTDSKTQKRGEDSDISISTVIVKTTDKNETGLVQQVNPPRYLGAIVVCHGADDPKVQLAITDAVSKVTGLGTNHISVLKMK